ncbi:hypothetical protein [Luteimicrobium subarcticum]|uniref:Uncharacterized protein n=1 Tax=Luteimicrobium subarcticum TaxID=620910 RepID=A0A2M8WJ34_9MICO|nr:hypothetical protein [Luteimicrobium subarcticum]PJI90923.1 hypothetical protein CLV34_2179 [Luteimicrobium subarcticum]
MRLTTTDDGLVLSVSSSDEMRRLYAALEAGYGNVSRAEFFIRTGLSAPEVEALADAVWRASQGENVDRALRLEAGVESVENPRRPRPPRKDDQGPDFPSAAGRLD